MPYVNSNGLKIYYEECGSGEPLLLIMGLGAPLMTWEPHSNEFKKHFRCILVDNRGAGKSDKPGMEFTTEMMAEDMLAVLDSLKISSTYIAGISMGSAIAQQIAIRNNERVKGMVLTSSWAACDAYTKSLFEIFKVLRKNLSPEDYTRYLQLVIYSPFYYNTLSGKLLKEAGEAEKGYMTYEAYVSQCRACANHNVAEQLDKISVPTLITVGERDIFTPLEFSKYIYRRIRGSELVVFENAGHVHHFEEVEKFNSTVIKFFLCLEEGKQYGKT